MEAMVRNSAEQLGALSSGLEAADECFVFFVGSLWWGVCMGFRSYEKSNQKGLRFFAPLPLLAGVIHQAELQKNIKISKSLLKATLKKQCKHNTSLQKTPNMSKRNTQNRTTPNKYR